MAQRWIAMAMGLLVLTCSLPLLALDPQRAPTEYVVDHWGFPAGLPQVSVTSIALDGNGFLWMSTQGGLARFDGLNFRGYGEQQIRGYRPAIGDRVWRDNSDRLWLGSSQGAAILDGDRLVAVEGLGAEVGHVHAFAVAPGTSEEQETSLLEDRLGALLEAAKALPKGRSFTLAVFDHRWTERPQRPPIATLQSKDWKDGPTLAYPLRSVRASIAPPAPDSAPAKTEPAKTEPAKTEPAKTEAAKTEAAKTEAAKTEPAKTEAAKTEAAKTEPAKIKRSFDGDPNARLAEAFEACQDLFFLESSADALGFAVELLDELMPSAAASACIYDIDADELRFVVTTGPGAASRQGEAIARKGLFGAATNVVGNTLRAERSDDRFEADLDGRPEPAGDHLLYVPLSPHGRLRGALQFFNEDAFSDSDAALALYVGNQLSSFLHQARMR